MTEQLKPCPFCGNTDLKSGGDDKIVGVWCENCQMTGPNHYGGFDWNTRPSASREIAVKPLEWHENDTYSIARTPDGHYWILDCRDGQWGLTEKGIGGFIVGHGNACLFTGPEDARLGADILNRKRILENLCDDTAPGNTDPIAKYDDELRKVQGGHERVKHIKRGSTYRVIGAAKVQTDRPLSDYAEVVIYQGETDGHIWARPVDEFEDPDRFESLPTEHPTEQPVSFDFRKFEREEATEQPSVRDAALIRSRAIKEFCEAAGIKASVQVAHLPDDVRRVRAQAALDQKLALRSLAQEGG